jgi:hypothetical protein
MTYCRARKDQFHWTISKIWMYSKCGTSRNNRHLPLSPSLSVGHKVLVTSHDLVRAHVQIADWAFLPCLLVYCEGRVATCAVGMSGRRDAKGWTDLRWWWQLAIWHKMKEERRGLLADGPNDKSFGMYQYWKCLSKMVYPVCFPFSQQDFQLAKSFLKRENFVK